jgi:broad specificity phosphatase PhoE
VRRRVDDFLGTVGGTVILCVSHGVVIQTFLASLLGGRYRTHDACVPENGSVHVLRLRGDGGGEFVAAAALSRPEPASKILLASSR